MNIIAMIILMAFNWALKLFMGWVAWHFTHWIFTDPAEWIVISIVAIAAVGTSIQFSWTDDRGIKWSVN